MKKTFDRITGIKGVGEKVAMAIIADMPDVQNFQKAGQFAAFAGVTPSHFQSGASVHGKSHISRLGSHTVRKALYMSALVVKNRNPHFQNFVLKLEKKRQSSEGHYHRYYAQTLVYLLRYVKKFFYFRSNFSFSVLTSETVSLGEYFSIMRHGV